uniref:Uncharacterized protein n=1 Tax=Tetranychus urticae TaxID=32264 RepID=T1KUC3_TETUR
MLVALCETANKFTANGIDYILVLRLARFNVKQTKNNSKLNKIVSQLNKKKGTCIT